MNSAGFQIVSLAIITWSFALTTRAAIFSSPRVVVLPSAQAAVATGDLNRDGLPDMIVGGDRLPSGGLGKIYVFLGKGNGSFQSPQVYDVGNNVNDPFPASYVQQINIADLNNDGNPDVVVAHNGDRNFLINQSSTFITILFGNDNGTLQPALGYILTDGLPNRVAVSFDLADLDNDQFLDIALVVNSGSNLGVVWVLKNLGNGVFDTSRRRVLNTNIWNIAVARLNRDRSPDFVMTTQIGVVIGYGAGDLLPSIFEQRDAGIPERGLVAKDFNSDGRIDFAVTPESASEIRLFLNSQFGFPQTPAVISTGQIPSSLTSIDLNRDGKLDLIIGYNIGGTYNFQSFFGNGDGTFPASEVLLQTNLPVARSAFADFDQNEKLDVASALFDQSSSSSPKIALFLNSPNPGRYRTDFDGDVRSDFSIFRPSDTTWWTLKSTDLSFRVIRFGLPTDEIVPGNYDGDNKADIAVYREGVWYILRSSDNSVRIEQWGISQDAPLPADYDNDGAMDLAVFRPSDGSWYIKKVAGVEIVRWGLGTDRPVPADYDGDGSADIAVFRPAEGVWYQRLSATGDVRILRFGLAEDKPVPGDFDGDGLADLAVYRPSTGTWYISQSSNNVPLVKTFGLAGDEPVPNDFDGDGKNDIAVYRPSEGNWYVHSSSDNFVRTIAWGTNADIPLSSVYSN